MAGLAVVKGFRQEHFLDVRDTINIQLWGLGQLVKCANILGGNRVGCSREGDKPHGGGGIVVPMTLSGILVQLPPTHGCEIRPTHNNSLGFKLGMERR